MKSGRPDRWTGQKTNDRFQIATRMTDSPEETELFWRKKGGAGDEVLENSQGALWVMPCCATKEEVAPTESNMSPCSNPWEEPLGEPLPTPATDQLHPCLPKTGLGAVKFRWNPAHGTSSGPTPTPSGQCQCGTRCHLSNAHTSKHPDDCPP